MKRDKDSKDIVWVYHHDKGSINHLVVSLGKVITYGVEILQEVYAGNKVVVARFQYL